jgi:xylulose-5-phosphate/fructose-6-phosphate phosphoketolase
MLKPGSVETEATRVLGKFLRDEVKLNLDKHNFRLFGPDETALSSARHGERGLKT